MRCKHSDRLQKQRLFSPSCVVRSIHSASEARRDERSLRQADSNWFYVPTLTPLQKTLLESKPWLVTGVGAATKYLRTFLRTSDGSMACFLRSTSRGFSSLTTRIGMNFPEVRGYQRTYAARYSQGRYLSA